MTCKKIFLLNLKIMKEILDLLSLKFSKKSEDYKILKKEVMNSVYNNLKEFYQNLQNEKNIKRCPNKCDLRNGFDKCVCGGSGYIELKLNN